MKILFLHKWLVMGGIEKVLINYLHLLKDEPNLTIDLLIAFDTEDNAFHHTIPQNVNITYLFDKQYYLQRRSLYLHRKSSLVNRIKEKYTKIREKSFYKTQLKKIMLANQYDAVINFSSHFDAYIPFYLTPTIRWVHSSLERSLTKKEQRKEQYYLNKHTKIVAICQEMAEEIPRIVNIPTEKICVIYNPINTQEVFKKSTYICHLPDAPYLVQVGRLDKIKQHHLLIDMYAELVKQGIKENLYILGDGEEFEPLKQQIAHLGLADRCVLLGEVRNPYPYMKNATLFLHTSKFEGFCLVLLESLILETPVVAFQCKTGTKEILNDGKCGILVPEGDKSYFIEAVKSLLDNRHLITSFKNNIQDHFPKFSEKRIKSQFLKLLNSFNNNAM